MRRRMTKPVWVGDVNGGGDAPISVQSMTKTDTRDVEATVRQIHELEEARSGPIRSAIGLGVLLYDGIGDTIRISLSDESREEVEVGYEILKALDLRKKGAQMVACPSCGRADVDIRKLAVMGCEVNGPGEAKDADVGIAAGAGRAVIFRKSRKARVVEEVEAVAAEIESVGA